MNREEFIVDLMPTSASGEKTCAMACRHCEYGGLYARSRKGFSEQVYKALKELGEYCTQHDESRIKQLSIMSPVEPEAVHVPFDFAGAAVGTVIYTFRRPSIEASGLGWIRDELAASYETLSRLFPRGGHRPQLGLYLRPILDAAAKIKNEAELQVIIEEHSRLFGRALRQTFNPDVSLSYLNVNDVNPSTFDRLLDLEREGDRFTETLYNLTRKVALNLDHQIYQPFTAGRFPHPIPERNEGCDNYTFFAQSDSREGKVQTVHVAARFLRWKKPLDREIDEEKAPDYLVFGPDGVWLGHSTWNIDEMGRRISYENFTDAVSEAKVNPSKQLTGVLEDRHLL